MVLGLEEVAFLNGYPDQRFQRPRCDPYFLRVVEAGLEVYNCVVFPSEVPAADSDVVADFRMLEPSGHEFQELRKQLLLHPALDEQYGHSSDCELAVLAALLQDLPVVFECPVVFARGSEAVGEEDGSCVIEQVPKSLPGLISRHFRKASTASDSSPTFIISFPI